MPCEICERLKKESDSHRNSWRRQEESNRVEGRSRTKGAKRQEKELQEDYEVAEAKFNVHRASHPENNKASERDYEILVREGRDRS